MPASLMQHLPTEIIINITLHFSDWNSLWAFISASPRHLHAYVASRNIVLPSVVRNQLNADQNLRQVYALQSGFDAPEGVRKSRTVIENTHQKQIDSVTIDDARSILHFERLIDDLVDDFVSSRLELVARFPLPIYENSRVDIKEHDHGGSKPRSVSAVERRRLKRAFYNLEVYYYIENIFQLTHLTIFDELHETLLSHGFILRLPHHEREEFYCVCMYIQDCMQDFIAKVDNDFLNEFRSRGPAYVNTHQVENRRRFRIEDQFFSMGLDNVSREMWTEVALTYGVRQLHAMIVRDSPETRLKAIRTLPIRGTSLSREAFHDTSEMNFIPVLQESCKEPSDESSESAETPGAAYPWVLEALQGPPERFNLLNRSKIQKMRRWGYCIWDNSRVKDWKMLDLDVHDCLDICPWPDSTWQRNTSGEANVRRIEKEWYSQGLLDKQYWKALRHENDWIDEEL